MKWSLTVLTGLSLLFMAGCSSVQHQQQADWLYPPMARPLQPTIQMEVKILRLSQLLQQKELSDDIRAKVFYERGNGYDMLGLRNLARLDFEQSLRFNPAQSEVFNMLGVYYTEIGDFDSAYESFDSTLELDPDNIYAGRNLAIALYYGNRHRLAQDEIEQVIQKDSGDPFSVLWRYFIASETDAKSAREALMQSYQSRGQQSDVWGWSLVAMMLGETDDQVIFRQILNSTTDNSVLAQRLTEAYFYLGRRYQMREQYADAIALYKLAISMNVYEYIEHRYAFLELERIYNTLKQNSSS
ncbi:lipoprotein NlpI [Vibrio mangrovi]|uniref:Lipoprotein NlpI n=1 Tax=Vibrio mangrovi TaxID=474394 RepID=A0A1Y6IUG2_9VIBR|nr:lipoprotein NlpI [Vibrio mangrovi]MDW6003075.1 lipoprotein NlpI [Vibrio mangrovi]SMS01317.1 Lipoprotein NlpI precursor [Vibrio mangrovi]